jgi:hypothetical protein
MKVISYYKYLKAGQTGMSEAGIGAGHWRTETCGIAIAKMLGDVTLVPREHGQSMRDIKDFMPVVGEFDIAYVDPFEVPIGCSGHRPGKIVYGILHDYIELEEYFKRYLDLLRPDYVFGVLYHKQDIYDICKFYGCQYIYWPYFVNEIPEYNGNRDLTAMCTGAWGQVYPQRTAVAKFLAGMNRPDIFVGMTNNQMIYHLSDDEYHNKLLRTKYYLSGGIFDWQIPAKYFEACSYGCCLVCFESPKMAELGFVDGVNYIKLNSVDEIPSIIDSDRYKEIGRSAVEFVRERHTIKQRFETLRNVLNERT